MKHCSALGILVFFLGVSTASAQVESNFSAGGGVRIGWSSTVCDASIAGALRYNSAGGGTIDFCNGTTWQNAGAAGGLFLDNLGDVRVNYTSNNMYLGHEISGTGSGALRNTVLGAEALNAAPNAADNTAMGYRALTAYTGTFGGMTAFGSGALEKQTGGSKNTAVGYRAAYTQATVDSTTAVGFQALYNNRNHNNTCVGNQCLYSNTTGAGNIALGNLAGYNITTGSVNIIIGAGVNAPSATGDRQLNIGNLIYGDMSANKFVGINTPAPAYTLHVTGDIAYTGVTTDISDARYKQDINPLPPALTQIMALKPVSFVMKDDPDRQVEYGFIAQDVQDLYPVLVKTANDADHTMSLNYTGLIAPLVKAIQEQQAQIDALTRALKERDNPPSP